MAKIDWTWPKVTGLLTVQAAAHTAIGLLVGKDALHLDWLQVGAASGLSAVVALLGAIVAYAVPGEKATAAVSAPVAVVAAVQAVPFVHDAAQARSTPATS
jgi:hypothetical protein